MEIANLIEAKQDMPVRHTTIMTEPNIFLKSKTIMSLRLQKDFDQTPGSLFDKKFTSTSCEIDKIRKFETKFRANY
jgi:hypothetical protein